MKIIKTMLLCAAFMLQVHAADNQSWWGAAWQATKNVASSAAASLPSASSVIEAIKSYVPSTDTISSYLPSREALSGLVESMYSSAAVAQGKLADVVREHPWWTAGALAAGTLAVSSPLLYRWWNRPVSIAPAQEQAISASRSTAAGSLQGQPADIQPPTPEPGSSAQEQPALAPVTTPEPVSMAQSGVVYPSSIPVEYAQSSEGMPEPQGSGPSFEQPEEPQAIEPEVLAQLNSSIVSFSGQNITYEYLRAQLQSLADEGDKEAQEDLTTLNELIFQPAIALPKLSQEVGTEIGVEQQLNQSVAMGASLVNQSLADWTVLGESAAQSQWPPIKIVNEQPFCDFIKQQIKTLKDANVIEESSYPAYLPWVLDAVRKGGAFAYQIFFNKFFDHALWKNKSHKNRLDDLISLTWYFYAQAFNKGEAFSQGTFIVQDPYGNFANVLMAYVEAENDNIRGTKAAFPKVFSSNPFAYARTSSHLGYSRTQGGEFEHYGIDVRYSKDDNVGHMLPAGKSHLLFGKIAPYGSYHPQPHLDIFFKPEDFGLSTKEGVHHGAEWIVSLMRKTPGLKQIIGGDDELAYRKERVIDAFAQEAKNAIDLANKTTQGFDKEDALAAIKNRGLSGFKQVIDRQINLSNDVKQAMNRVYEKYAKDYDHLDRRIGREVILTQGDLIDAVWYAGKAPAPESLQFFNAIAEARLLIKNIRAYGFDVATHKAFETVLSALNKPVPQVNLEQDVDLSRVQAIINDEHTRITAALNEFQAKADEFAQAQARGARRYFATQPAGKFLIPGKWEESSFDALFSEISQNLIDVNPLANKFKVSKFTPQGFVGTRSGVAAPAAVVVSLVNLDENQLKAFAARYALAQMQDGLLQYQPVYIIQLKEGVRVDQEDKIVQAALNITEIEIERLFFIVDATNAAALLSKDNETFWVNMQKPCNVILFDVVNIDASSLAWLTHNQNIGWYNFGLASFEGMYNIHLAHESSENFHGQVLAHFPYIAKKIHELINNQANINTFSLIIRSSQFAAERNIEVEPEGKK